MRDWRWCVSTTLCYQQRQLFEMLSGAASARSYVVFVVAAGEEFFRVFHLGIKNRIQVGLRFGLRSLMSQRQI